MLFNKMKLCAILLCMPLLANAATDSATENPLRFGTRLSLNSVGEITDASWGVFASGVGVGATFSLDASYRFLPWLYLHAGVGMDYRYFVSDNQVFGLSCDGCKDAYWDGENKDYLLYLEIPLFVQAHIADIVYFETGPVFDFNLMRKSEFFLPKEHRTDKCQKDRIFGAGISVGIGHVFSFGLFVDVRLSYQLTDVVTVDKKCDCYKVSGWSSRMDKESGTESVEKLYEFNDDFAGSYFLLNKIQLGIGYWF